MRDQYLWDRTGEPDPDVVRLERSLGVLRHRHRALDYTRMPAARPERTSSWALPRALLAAAASVIVLAAVAVLVPTGFRTRCRAPPLGRRVNRGRSQD